MTEELNPYSPPKSDVTASEESRALVPASKGRRFGTVVVDYTAFLALSFCIGAGAVLFFGERGSAALESVNDTVLGVLIISGYYVFFEGLWARTPGKLVFGTVVVAESGGKPSLGQVLGRTLCRFIPFEVFSCLGQRGWHDSIPKTLVVLVKPS